MDQWVPDEVTGEYGELRFSVLVNPSCVGLIEGMVAFETGVSRKQVEGSELCVYEHHGPDFGPKYPGALTQLFEDLLLGRPLPLKMVLRHLADVDSVWAVALYLRRDLLIHPATPGLVASVDLVHRYGLTLLGHLDSDLGRFLRLLRAYLPPTLSPRETGEKLAAAVAWIHDLVLNGRLPHLGPSWPEVRVVDQGPNGFVVAETRGSLLEGWVELYRQGYLQGVLISPPDREQRRQVMVSKKSGHLVLDLGRVARILNELERSQGELPGWVVEGSWLRSPPDGTALLVSDLIRVVAYVG